VIYNVAELYYHVYTIGRNKKAVAKDRAGQALERSI